MRHWGVAVLALLAASCGGDDSDDPPLPSRPQALNVSTTEYRFDFRAPTRPGRVVVKTRNDGRVRHEVVMLELPPNFPPIKEQIAGKERRFVGTLAYQLPLRPGRRGALAVDVKRARYALVCLQEAPDGKRHADKGMATEFRIG